MAEQTKLLGAEVAELDLAVEELKAARERHTLHRNEIEMLGLKFRRSAVARAILGDVSFTECPRCAQHLPERSAQCCVVCGQEDRLELEDASEQAALEVDIAARRADLEGAIKEIDANLAKIRRTREGLVSRKAKLEVERNRSMAEADSAFLSTVLLKERERAALEAELVSLSWLLRLPDLLRQQREAYAQIVAMEQMLREALKDARTQAESVPVGRA